MFSDATVAKIRARVNILTVVQDFLPLQRSGPHYRGRCPFHDERTASFYVTPARGIFHCFGCKANGDIFDFVQRMEGMTFPETVHLLASRAGVELESEDADSPARAEALRQREVRERLLFACETACKFFEHCLQDPEKGELARAELARRKLDNTSATYSFRLGYAPAEWSALLAELQRHSVSPADAELAGLLIQNRPGHWYDRFRHRVMFPIVDRMGAVVGFSGRILPTTEAFDEALVPPDAGKYINTPETPLFRKSEHVFGLHVARRALRTTPHALLVEGNFDVVAMHGHEMTTAVAPLGTAVTEAQAKLLRRFAEDVTVVFDADAAGIAAIRPAYTVLRKAGLRVFVAELPLGAKDPDAVLRDPQGAQTLKEHLAAPMDAPEWILRYIATHTSDRVPDRAAALWDCASLLHTVPDALERMLYEELVVRLIQVSPANLQAAQEALAKLEKDRHASP